MFGFKRRGVQPPPKPVARVPASYGPDGFPVHSDDPRAAEQTWLSEFLRHSDCVMRWPREKVHRLPEGERIASMNDRERMQLILAAAERMTWNATTEASNRNTHYRWQTYQALAVIIEDVSRCGVAPDAQSLQQLLEHTVSIRLLDRFDSIPLRSVLGVVQKFAKVEPLTEAHRELLRRTQLTIKRSDTSRGDRRLSEAIDKLVGVTRRLPIEPGEAWSDRALADIASMSDDHRAAWTELLHHATAASSAKPSAKWLAAAKTHLDSVGSVGFVDRADEWFILLEKPRTQPKRRDLAPDGYWNNLIIDKHGDILRGLAWCLSQIASPAAAAILSRAAITCYKKVPGIGPRAPRIGNACVHALGRIGGTIAVGQLAVIRSRIKVRSAQKEIEKALSAAAAAAGVSPEELEEIATPSLGLSEVGRRIDRFGEWEARSEVTEGGSVETTFTTGKKKPRKSVPAALKASHPEELKSLNAAVKEISRSLPAQRDRIDSLFLQRRSWSERVWRERYLNHPLTGVIARRLIWTFTSVDKTQSGVWDGKTMTDRFGAPIAATNESVKVALWHPIEAPPAEVLGWRERLESLGIRQSFKQAHREVYLLTDAERRTEVYSNRFAAHLLKQHQFNALCAARGWRNQLRLMVDATYPPATRLLPAWNLRVEFWIEGAGGNFGTDTNQTGTYLYLTTDQVRFYPLQADQLQAHAGGGGYSRGRRRVEANPDPIALELIPPLVFSEIMRDVDLFVGVASVGNDANWLDAGRDDRQREYWTHMSFGELGASAATRKAVLERLIPRLAISPRCSFEEKCLVVRGDLRVYKIHLGSGNILISPENKYLCIVPGPSERGTVDGKMFLPFDGDRTLSIILSKAFMLTEDVRIKDPSIVSQIVQGGQFVVRDTNT